MEGGGSRGVEPERLLFVDECGTHTSLAPIYGYAPKSERLHLSVPRGGSSAPLCHRNPL